MGLSADRRFMALLTVPQRRRLLVALSSAEAALAAAEGASADSGALTLQRRVPDLPPGFPGPLGVTIAALRQDIDRLAGVLGLTPLESSVSRHIAALCTTAAIDLEDSESRRLKGYGPVDPAVAIQVDPTLRRLEEGLFQIAAALMNGRLEE